MKEFVRTLHRSYTYISIPTVRGCKSRARERCRKGHQPIPIRGVAKKESGETKGTLIIACSPRVAVSRILIYGPPLDVRADYGKRAAPSALFHRHRSAFALFSESNGTAAAHVLLVGEKPMSDEIAPGSSAGVRDASETWRRQT